MSKITESALRVKITGSCNRSCSFCHQEGNMQGIDFMKPDKDFFNCINSLTDFFGINRVMLTGGEPTIHPDLSGLIEGINAQKISITTNGICCLTLEEWKDLFNKGLNKVIMSVHDSNPESFISMEAQQRSLAWAIKALKAQRENIIAINESGLDFRINTVAYHSLEQVYQVFEFIEDLWYKYNFDIRILNNLARVEESQKIILDFCKKLGAEKINKERRLGSSNVTSFWKTKTDFCFSTKIAYQYFFEPICKNCSLREECHEGFYGIRIEKRKGSYWVRLCLYKETNDVLLEWNEFLKSKIAQELKNVYIRESE